MIINENYKWEIINEYYKWELITIVRHTNTERILILLFLLDVLNFRHNNVCLIFITLKCLSFSFPSAPRSFHFVISKNVFFLSFLLVENYLYSFCVKQLATFLVAILCATVHHTLVYVGIERDRRPSRATISLFMLDSQPSL